MKILADIYKIIIESIFPLSSLDKKLFSYTPEQASKILPPAPKLPILKACSIFAYKNDLVRRLVWNIKYKKSEKAIKIGGYALYQSLLKLFQYKSNLKVLIIPIPMTARRRRERGFNQCELLLKEIENLDNKRYFLFRKDLLERIQHSSRQTLKNRHDRLISAKNIFSVSEKNLHEIRNTIMIEKQPVKIEIIVIDDVITTGSTMKEALETLEKAGFEEVQGLSLAH